MYSLVAVLIFICIGSAPIGTYYNFDPGYFFFDYIFHPIENQSWALRATTFVIRYLATHWSVLEICRSLSLVLLASMSYCNMLTIFLREISKIRGSDKTIMEYAKLQCVNQVGIDAARNLAGLLMGAGFVICVCGNWLSVFEWRFIPFEVNISMCLVTLVVYLVIYETLPLYIKCHEFSKQMVKGWKYEYMKKQSVSSKKIIRIWKRILRAQQPINLYWGTTKFKRETNVNFYSNIIDYKVDMMLGSAAKNKK